jgi:hypothetical protein
MLRDTPVTPYTRPPISTDLATRDRPQDGNLQQSDGNLPHSAIFCQVLLGPLRESYSALCTY